MCLRVVRADAGLGRIGSEQAQWTDCAVTWVWLWAWPWKDSRRGARLNVWEAGDELVVHRVIIALCKPDYWLWASGVRTARKAMSSSGCGPPT